MASPIITPGPTPTPPPEDENGKSPAPPWLKSVVAGIYLIIWLVVIIYDFIVHGGEAQTPAWFQATGLIVLGYLLGINLGDLTRMGRGKK